MTLRYITLILNSLMADAGNIEHLFSAPSKSGRRAKNSSKSKPANTEETQVAVGAKDATLFLFRALGKVLYCKRKLDKVLFCDH